MNIQIFGRKKCFDTQKAERYFKERKIKFQAIDIDRYGISKGEFTSVKNVIGISTLVNELSKDYERLNLNRIRTESIIEEILLNNPTTIKTPIVRNGKKATIGYQPEVWTEWEKD